ncbi:MAG: hypothetical protein U0575_04575 [Phycisphaerales bacterium]
MSRPLTTIHVTHEACEKIGGIGAVLEGLITSPVYRSAVARTILIGPLFNHFERPGDERLGPDAQVLYSGLDGIDRANIGVRLKPIEWAFNVAIVYGRRRFHMATPGDEDGRSGDAEVLLIDVANISRSRIDKFKARLFERFGLDSLRYEHDWGYEEYVRLAEPAFHAALALIRPEEMPAIVLAHEFMGLPTAFKAILDGGDQVRTVFHAHECSTARRIVEALPGHDTAFYNVLREARALGLVVGDVFGDQSDSFRHALVSRSHLCDAIFAVGTLVAEEIHFLDRHFDHHAIDLVHNGIPAWPVRPRDRLGARAALRRWAERTVGIAPDLLFTHVTRPVVSKGIWRDLDVCRRLDASLAAEGRTALLIVLTSAGGVRRSQDVRMMSDEYGWPRGHREGYPDLVGPEIELFQAIDAFNRGHRAVQAVLVNQFGWSDALVGGGGGAEGVGAMDALGTMDMMDTMDMATLRAGTDLEFGMATYEPFGISPLEPLASGAICVVSSVCGCRWFAQEAAAVEFEGGVEPNVIVADFTSVGDSIGLVAMRSIDRAAREAVEAKVADEVAAKLLAALPRSDHERLRLLERGQRLAARMGWDTVLERHLLPTLRRVTGRA